MSTQSKHTPGPWWAEDDGYIAAGSREEYRTIADVSGFSTETEEQANARLIAAAPAMAEYIFERAASGCGKAQSILDSLR